MLLTGIYACNEAINEVTDDAQSENKIIEYNIATLTFDPSNSNNQYDYIGQMHNLGLEYVKNNFDDSVDPSDLGEVINGFNEVLGEFADQQGYTSTEIGDIQEDFEELFDGTFASNNTNYLVNMNISTVAAGYISSVFDILDGMNQSEIDIPFDLTIFIDDIKDIETDIFSSNLSTTEEQLVLGFTSITRYSLAYWYDVAANPTDPWHDALGMSCSSGPSKIDNSKNNGSVQYFETFIDGSGSDISKLGVMAGGDGAGFIASGGNACVGLGVSGFIGIVVYWDDICGGVGDIIGAIGGFFGGIFG
jgi:hypothetical protein